MKANSIFFILSVFVTLTVSAFGNYEISWHTIDGGGRSSGGDFALVGTIGQPGAGQMADEDYALSGGFWPGWPLVSCIVNFNDFVRFAEWWLEPDCNAGNNWCGGADLDFSTDVTVADLSEVAYLWLCTCPEDWPLK